MLLFWSENISSFINVYFLLDSHIIGGELFISGNNLEMMHFLLGAATTSELLMFCFPIQNLGNVSSVRNISEMS
jgi:hypothetical protein